MPAIARLSLIVAFMVKPLLTRAESNPNATAAPVYDHGTTAARNARVSFSASQPSDIGPTNSVAAGRLRAIRAILAIQFINDRDRAMTATTPLSPTAARSRALAVGLTLVLSATGALPFTASISKGSRTLFLQVGAGSMSGGTYSGGGTPGNNSTINTVTASVPAVDVGAGSVAMTTDSTVTNSPYDNFTICPNLGSMVYVGGFFRTPGGSSSDAVLTAQSPASLTSGVGDSIPFDSISWVSSGAGDTSPTISSGTFMGGTQTLFSVNRNQWFESCMTFSYGNSAVVPPGTYTGRVTYTLTAP